MDLLKRRADATVVSRSRDTESSCKDSPGGFGLRIELWNVNEW